MGGGEKDDTDKDEKKKDAGKRVTSTNAETQSAKATKAMEVNEQMVEKKEGGG